MDNNCNYKLVIPLIKHEKLASLGEPGPDTYGQPDHRHIEPRRGANASNYGQNTASEDLKVNARTLQSDWNEERQKELPSLQQRIRAETKR